MTLVLLYLCGVALVAYLLREYAIETDFGAACFVGVFWPAIVVLTVVLVAIWIVDDFLEPLRW